MESISRHEGVPAPRQWRALAFGYVRSPLLLAMFRHRPIRLPLLPLGPRLRDRVTMTSHHRGRLAIVRGVVSHCRPVIEMFADLVTSKNLGRDQSRRDLAARVAHDEAVDAGFPRRPIFARRYQNGASRCSGRSTEHERMDTLAAEHLDVRHLAGPLFHDDRSGRAPRERC